MPTRVPSIALVFALVLHSSANAVAKPDNQSPATHWQALSALEKTAVVQGLLDGSRLATDIALRHFRVGLAGLTARPEWFRDKLERDGKAVMRVEVPSRFAVVYLPKGTYAATIEADGRTRRRTLEGAH